MIFLAADLRRKWAKVDFYALKNPVDSLDFRE